MKNGRLRTAADVAVGYSADPLGRGIAYAAIATGNATSVIRLTFAAKPSAALEGRELGYAAISALADRLKHRGFGHVRVRIGDARVATELNGAGAPPKPLAMAYVRIRCALRSMGFVRLDAVDALDVRDLTTRARAEVSLHVAA